MSDILLFTCLLALCLPILSVTLSRRNSTFFRTRSTIRTEPRSERRARPLRRHAHSHSLSPSTSHSFSDANSLSLSHAHSYSYARTQTDGPASDASEDGADQTPQPQPQPQLRVRKPWDPPFRRESIVGSERGSRIESGSSFMPPSTSPSRADTPTSDTIAKNTAQPNTQENTSMKPDSLSVLSLVSRILAVLLFILGFAVLIAHCLAWFLVYKTEARLGEARRGLVRGGDMRLCLCAK